MINNTGITMDPWTEITQLTGYPVPLKVKSACTGPRIVIIPAGRILHAAGPAGKPTMVWGAFEEMDAEWYSRGNQLDPSWYTPPGTAPVPIYEYYITLTKPTPAVMSKVADQPGAATRIGPPKFQFYNPSGFGPPLQGRLLGKWKP
jgi:hypothetical protein